MKLREIVVEKALIPDLKAEKREDVVKELIESLITAGSVDSDLREEDENCLDVNFLDLNLCIENEKFTHKTFRKPLNAYAYLPWSSCHPPSVKKGIVATELQRILRILVG